MKFYQFNIKFILFLLVLGVLNAYAATLNSNSQSYELMPSHKLSQSYFKSLFQAHFYYPGVYKSLGCYYNIYYFLKQLSYNGYDLQHANVLFITDDIKPETSIPYTIWNYNARKQSTW